MSQPKRSVNMPPYPLQEWTKSIIAETPAVNKDDPVNEEHQPSVMQLSKPEAMSSESETENDAPETLTEVEYSIS